MGEKWLTSGRAQIKAMQKRSSFSANATARAVLNERPCRTNAAKAEQSGHKSKHRIGTRTLLLDFSVGFHFTQTCSPDLALVPLAVRANYSAYADPILRRAVVGQGSEIAEETEDYAIHPSRRRRIRDHRALYSHYNPQYGKPKAREVCYQITPQTVQDDAGGYYDRRYPTTRYETNRTWYTSDQHTSVLDSSSNYSHIDQTQVLDPYPPQHPPGLQRFQDHSSAGIMTWAPHKHQHDFHSFAAVGGQGSGELGSVFSHAHEECSQTNRAFANPHYINNQRVYQHHIPVLSPPIYESASHGDPFLHADMSSQVLDSFPGLEDAFNEDTYDPLLREFEEVFPNNEAAESVFENSIQYCVEPEQPSDNPIPHYVSIEPAPGIARFQRKVATASTAASTKKSDQSFLRDNDDLEPRGLMLPPRDRDSQRTNVARSHEHYTDQEDEVVRVIPTWKENPAIRFFNEKVEVDAENRPLSRPGSPVFRDELNLLGKKSLWE
jgi:hypothetical protein